MFMESTPELPPIQSFEEFQAEVAPTLVTEFKSKFRAGFIGDLTKAAPRRDWLLKGALTGRTLLLVFGEPGCISGDAEMYYQVRDAAGRKRSDNRCSLENLYLKFHRRKPLSRGRFTILGDDKTLWLSSVADDGKIFRNQVLDIVDSGNKSCFRLVLIDGREIRATGDHRFMCEQGYIPLSELRPGDFVLAHSHEVENCNRGLGQSGQRKMFYVRSHPTARTKIIDRYKYKVVPRSRAVIEAAMNGMSLPDYIGRLNAGQLDGLKTLNQGLDVHHKNEDFTDDRLDNLEVLEPAEHSLRHSRGSLRFMAKPTQIVSIVPAGVMRTYDIKMAAPYNNFMASDFAVHNCGKSFLLLDYAMNMALACVDPVHSEVWFGRKVAKLGVVYVAAEGEDDFIIRMHAWKAAHGVADLELPIYLIPMAVDMRTGQERTEQLIAEIKDREQACLQRFGVKFGLVVIDTLNKCLAGGNDSKPEDIGPFLANCNRIREECNVSVAPVHHMPKDARSVDPRGHSSLKGDIDFHWYVVPAKDGAPNSWTITRAKAGPTGAKHEFRLRQIILGQDEDGDAITSCVVTALATEPSLEEADMRDAAGGERRNMTADGRAIIPDNQTLILKALHQAAESVGEALPYGKDGDGKERPIHVPHGRKAVSMAQWTDEMVKIMPGDDKAGAKFKDKCRKARDAAASKFTMRGLIAIDGDWVWRTGRRVAGVDRPERDVSPPSVEIPGASEATF